jgi:hypothetical protein
VVATFYPEETSRSLAMSHQPSTHDTAEALSSFFRLGIRTRAAGLVS